MNELEPKAPSDQPSKAEAPTTTPTPPESQEPIQQTETAPQTPPAPPEPAVSADPPTDNPVNEPIPNGPILKPIGSIMEKKSKASLIIIIVILLALLGGGAYYAYSRVQNLGNDTTSKTPSISSTAPSQKEAETKNDTAGTGTSVDIDAEVKALDDTLSAFSEDDFSETTLSETQVGL